MKQKRMASEEPLLGHLFNIQRFSLDDGPGIRSTVFLKGCNQHCSWCHNPESLRVMPQLMRKHSLCTGCGACIKACPRGANVLTEGRVETTADCNGCGTCVGVCPVRALKVMGYSATADEVMETILKDKPFYQRSAGGVTFSGGEPSCQGPFLLSLLERCKEAGLHTAIETNGNTSAQLVEQISALTDYVMIDLKHVDEEKHRAFTGAGNERTLWAIRYYTAHNQTEVRIPVIPTFNDTAPQLQQMFDFLHQIGVDAVTILPYHTFGISKYESLSMPYPLSEREATAADQISALLGQMDDRGLKVTIH